jgi:hypothetical protein
VITQALMNLFHGLAVTLSSWLSGALPSPPSFWTDATSGLTQVVALVPSAVLWFLPVVPILAAGGVLVGLVVAFGILRFGRRVLSLFTGGGGNA